MHLPILLVCGTVLAQAQTIADIHELTPREHRVSAFVLTAPQDLQVSAVGAEPWPDRLRNRDAQHWQDDDQTTWPAAAWIVDARTRAVVWDLRAADTRRESNGLRRFSGNVHLPAGTYEAHYASYPASFISFNGDINLNLKDIIRLGRRVKYGGTYVENGSYKEFALTISGAGRSASQNDITAAHAAFTASAIATIAPERNTSMRKGFEISRPTDVEIYAIGELRRDGAFDYGWIMNAATRERVWTMTYDNSEPAGGAQKNRMVRETLGMKPGRYVAYFVSDDSHSPDDWNAVPANDPEFWGLTLRVRDAAARAAVLPFEYEPVPAGQTLVSLTGIGNHAVRSAGFTLRRAMDVRVYALGEGSSGGMVDFAWIVDATRHRRVWTMRYEDTEDAGGAKKNRLFDGTVHLDAGSYIVHYQSDDSHSYNDWNAAPPAEARYWGVSVFPASGRLNAADAGPFVAAPAGAVVAQLVPMGNDEDARATFRLAREASLRVYALGEGSGGDMNDYGWIEDAASGRVVWEMTYGGTDPAGGARKNRVFEGVITLPAGAYVLRYKSDGSHAFNDWNDDPPDDPDNWGITVFRMGDR